jgi:hypothetical protein
MRMNAFASVRDQLIGVELVLRRPACDDAIGRLKRARGAIDQAAGYPLEWNAFSGSVRISLSHRGYNIADRPDWSRQHGWLIDKIKLFQQILLKRIDGTDGE